MKKILAGLFLSIFITGGLFGASYDCNFQSDSGSSTATLKFSRGNLVCGHKGADGCNDGVCVSVSDGIPTGKSSDIPIYCCSSSGVNQWIDKPVSYIRDCGADELPELLGEFDSYNVYYKKSGTGEALADYCRIDLADAESNCINTGGTWDDNECICSGSVEKDGGLDVSPCKCVADLVLGTDLNGNNPNKCWPKPYLAGKCLKENGTNDWYCPSYSGAYGDHSDTVPEYYFWKVSDKDCVCGDWTNNKRICINGDHAEYRSNCECPGFSFDATKTAYDNSNYEGGYDNEGFGCIKPSTKFNYKACSSDSDCTGIDNTVRPYLHSTAWHCAWQSADVRVCTVTACESGWTPKDGYCQEDKTPAPTNTQNLTTGSTVQQVGQAGTTTVSKTTVKKTCTDPNMDSNCKCVVPKTTERGVRCVCIDGDKEIKNGKCEYTAEYISKIESELDAKYASLSATIGGFEKNVWRDAEGNFNTSRLVSDSVAGVVLGTVGGIVTSRLVKKAQVKKGFEDIGCYIGGQSVAGYGDEFMVGR